MAFELGTPGYMSPENMPPEYKALKNMPLGPLTFDMLKASDIWSLGVTIMFMLLPHALTSKLGLELTNEIMDKLFVNSATNKHLTFVQRIEKLFPPKDSIFIMTTCYKEIINIFGLSATWESFFSDDWTKRASIEELKTAFDNQTAANTMMPPPMFMPPTKKPKTKSAGAKSRRKKRGSKLAKNVSAYKKPRSSRK